MKTQHHIAWQALYDFRDGACTSTFAETNVLYSKKQLSIHTNMVYHSIDLIGIKFSDN